MFSVKTDVKAWTRKMDKVNKELLPRAQVKMLNRACKAAHDQSIKNIKKDFTIRNTYTVRSIRFSPAKVRSSGVAGYAVTGSISPYLPIQEKGGIVRPKRKQIVGPTKKARGGQWGKPVKPKYRLSQMGKIGTRKGGGRMQPAGAKFFILHPGSASSGLNVRHTLKRYKKIKRGRKYWKYRLMQPAIFTREGGKLVKVRYIRKSSYRLKATHWHTNAVKKFGNKRVMGRIFVQEAKKQLGKVG